MVAIPIPGDDPQGEEFRLALDELAREGAWRMLVAALEWEVESYLEAHREWRDEGGGPWGSATAGPGPGRGFWGRGGWRSGLPG